MKYQTAIRIFGHPDVVHTTWDTRAQQEVAPNDVVVFAKYDEHYPPKIHAADDSWEDIIAHGGIDDRP